MALIAAVAVSCLSGMGAAQILASREQVDFGPVSVGAAAVESITLYSTSAVARLRLTLTRPFSFAVAPPSALLPGRALTIWVRFRPAQAGPADAELRGNGVAIRLRGSGLQPGTTPTPTRKAPGPASARLTPNSTPTENAPPLPPRTAPPAISASTPAALTDPQANAPSLSLSDQTVSISLYSPQDTQSATVTVSGISGVPIGSVVPDAPPGIFALTSTCPAQPASVSTCTITATAAASPGAPSQYEQVDLDSPNGSTLASVLFRSVNAYVAYSATPPAVDFGGVSVGDTGSRAITVANTGGWEAGLTVQSSAPGELSANGCPPWVNPGDTCTLTVTLAPADLGPFTGSVTLGSLNTPDQLVIPISATGLPSGPGLSAASLSFQGTLGESQSIVLSNPTSRVLNILGMTASPSFVPSAPCTSIPPGQTCNLSVQYQPAAATNGLAQDGQLSIFTGQPPSILQVALHAAANRPSLTLDRAEVQFSPQQVGTAGPKETLSITNTGQASANVGIQAAGDFGAESDCTSLAPGATCTASLTFAPSAAGQRNGVAMITAAGALQTVGLTGNGVLPPPKPNHDFPLGVASGAIGGFGLNLAFPALGIPDKHSPAPEKGSIQAVPGRVQVNCAIPGRDAAAPLKISNASAQPQQLTFLVAGPFEVTGCTELPAHGFCVAGVTYHPTAQPGSTNGLLIITGQGSSLPVAVVQLAASAADSVPGSGGGVPQ